MQKFNDLYKILTWQCNEAKPSCEYCADTGRNCEYVTPSVKRVKLNSFVADARFPDWALDVALNVRHSSVVLPHKQRKQLVRYPAPRRLVYCTSRVLKVSNFELRLLHFFEHYCIPLFSMNVHKKVELVWRNEIPKLWNSSTLIRQAVYLFSALNLWPLCDLKQLAATSIVDVDQIGDCKHYTSIIDPDSNPNGGNLYVQTIEYFASCLESSIDNIGYLLRQGKAISTFKSAEILVSGILIFSFLGMHPHRIVPLISFDRSETDLLQICDGLRITYVMNIQILLHSPYNGLFLSDECMEPTVSPKYPIIENLKYRLDELPDDNCNKKVYLQAITLLETCLFRSVTLNYARPLFRWILMQDELTVLARANDRFALKILFTFACLCRICKFHLYPAVNMWQDYIEWYKQDNIGHDEKVWIDMDDMLLYKFVKEQDFDHSDMQIFRSLDPYLIE